MERRKPPPGSTRLGCPVAQEHALPRLPELVINSFSVVETRGTTAQVRPWLAEHGDGIGVEALEARFTLGWIKPGSQVLLGRARS